MIAILCETQGQILEHSATKTIYSHASVGDSHDITLSVRLEDVTGSGENGPSLLLLYVHCPTISFFLAEAYAAP